MIVSGRRIAVSGLLLLAVFLALAPISPVSTYTGGGALVAGSTSWHFGNATNWQRTWHTGSQHTWQSTAWQHSGWVYGSATYTHTVTFTHSSSIIIRTFTNSPRTFSHTGALSVTTTAEVFPPQAPCYPGYFGCPGYPYYYTTYYQAPTTYYEPPSSSCYTGTPGYPYNCPSVPSEPVTTVQSYPTSVMTGGIPLIPVTGVMAHDIWLIITPLPGGQFAIVLNAQGLQQNGDYLIEGVTRATPSATVPIATTPADSELVADVQGNGVYWHVLASDPQVTYGQVMLIYLPNNQIQGSQLIASASLG